MSGEITQSNSGSHQQITGTGNINQFYNNTFFSLDNPVIKVSITAELEKQKRQDLINNILAFYRSDDRVKSVMAQYVYRVYGENGQSKRFVDLTDEQLQDMAVFTERLKAVYIPVKASFINHMISWFKKK